MKRWIFQIHATLFGARIFFVPFFLFFHSSRRNLDTVNVVATLKRIESLFDQEDEKREGEEEREKEREAWNVLKHGTMAR